MITAKKTMAGPGSFFLHFNQSRAAVQKGTMPFRTWEAKAMGVWEAGAWVRTGALGGHKALKPWATRGAGVRAVK